MHYSYLQQIGLDHTSKDKKGITIINAFHKFLDESGDKPNKKRVDKGSKFYNR